MFIFATNIVRRWRRDVLRWAQGLQGFKILNPYRQAAVLGIGGKAWRLNTYRPCAAEALAEEHGGLAGPLLF
jgi:hypothetical protein